MKYHQQTLTGIPRDGVQNAFGKVRSLRYDLHISPTRGGGGEAGNNMLNHGDKKSEPHDIFFRLKIIFANYFIFTAYTLYDCTTLRSLFSKDRGRKKCYYGGPYQVVDRTKYC